MKVLLSSKSDKKINAVKEALNYLKVVYDLEDYKIESLVSDNPINEEIIKGAENRNNNLKKLGIKYDMLISIEAGFTHDETGYFLDTYCIVNYKNKDYIGMSPRLKISKLVFNYVKSGNVLHLLVQELQGTETNDGVIGYLSNGKLTRTFIEEYAVIDALKQALGLDKDNLNIDVTESLDDNQIKNLDNAINERLINMIEYLDYYDEDDNYLGKEDRNIVHQKGLWHHTIHCWLYTKTKDVIFQIRKDSNKFYTTASGHVRAGETLQEAFNREVKEEIGIDISSSCAELIDVVTWKMDKVKKDGTEIHDRVKAQIYIDLYEGNFNDFHFQEDEVLGIVVVNAKRALNLFKKGKGTINAMIITDKVVNKRVSIDDFLIMDGETQLSKYGDILETIIKK